MDAMTTHLIMAFTVKGLLIGLLQTVVATLVFFIIIALLCSHIRYQQLTHQAISGDLEDLDSDDVFHIAVARYLGTVRKTPDPFTVFMLRVNELKQLEEAHGPEKYEAAQSFVLEQLNQQVRKTDTVMSLGDGVYGLAIATSRDNIEAAYHRIINEAFHEAYRSEGVFLKLSASSGAASFPENGVSVRELVEAAECELEQSPLGSMKLAEEKVQEQADEAEDNLLPAAPKKISNIMTEPLTGLMRREKMGAAMQKYIAKLRKEEQPASMIYIDIDNLDRYNQHYGMKAGDAILTGVGKILDKHLRKVDLIGHVDGEEFIICLPGRVAFAFGVAERVIQEIKKTPFIFGDNELRITACAGVSGFPEHGVIAKQLFDASEIALNFAKARGRSMCNMYDPEMLEHAAEYENADTL